MVEELAIETHELTKVYRTRWSGREYPALTGLSLRVPVGSKYGLLGPNGAGKTTFVKMLLSAVRPTSGEARIFGRNAEEAEARRPVGFLPENHRFPTYLTGTGMLDFYGALSGIDAPQRRARTTELLQLVGLADWGDVRIKKYSKGMLQRLGLAQALFHRPRLLVLDEPTDGVDPVGRRQIRDILNSLIGTGVTVFINSHLLSEVESFCDYVAILHRGRMALQGRVAALTAESGYSVVSTPLPEEAVRRLQGDGAALAPHPLGHEIHLGSRAAANAAIDLIRAAGGQVDSVGNRASTLEDVFIRATAPGERAA